MNFSSTREAFEDLLIQKWDQLPEGSKHNWKFRFYNNQLAEDKMRKILLSFNYVILEDTLWGRGRDKMTQKNKKLTHV